MTLAVVNLGLPKSGTTTLARALRVSRTIADLAGSGGVAPSGTPISCAFNVSATIA